MRGEHLYLAQAVWFYLKTTAQTKKHVSLNDLIASCDVSIKLLGINGVVVDAVNTVTKQT